MVNQMVNQIEQPENLEPIRVRFLNDHEYYKLEAIFDDYKAKLPLPSLSKIAIAQTINGAIVGFYCFQLIPHAEPIWIHQDYQGSDIWNQLVLAIEPFTRLRGAFVVADNPKVEFMAQQLGLKRIDSPVYWMPSQEERRK